MKTWNDIEKAVNSKLNVTGRTETENEYYNQYVVLANEALNEIANGIKPMLKHYKFDVLALDEVYTTEDDLPQPGVAGELYYVVGGHVVYQWVEATQGYGEVEVDTDWYVSGDLVTMPDDFISFIGLNVLCNTFPCHTFSYYGYNSIIVREPGVYVVAYNANYPFIVEATIDEYETLFNEDKHHTRAYFVTGNEDLGIPRAVLNCLPSYIASKCLQEDDIQRSSILSNDFELQLSRLDSTELYDVEHFESEGGWY